MPPKNTYSHDSIKISSTSSKFRSNFASDLITKSEAALSSQASVYTQRTNASQETNLNFNKYENQYNQFNREDITEVFISKEEQQIIQNILQFARKGKVNSKNAFDVPIKVVHSESVSSVNNKFWKFASQLLDASMSIYDKRVQNMYINIGAFQNKLSRIGFSIKNRVEGQNQDKFDDINAEQEHKRKKNKQERQQMLRISVNDFSGTLNLDNQEIIGYQTIQKKDKLNIKNIENKFIADPTFERTQKVFDSFSLKSLMLNIFGVSSDLNIGLFHKSDLESEKRIQSRQIQLSKNQLENSVSQVLKNHKENDSQSIHSEGDIFFGGQNCQKTIKSEKKAQKLFTQNNYFSLDFGNGSLSNELQKHLQISHDSINQKSILSQVTEFISNQPQLRQDYLQRNANRNKKRKQSCEENQFQKSQNQFQVTYREIIQKETIEFSEIFNKFYEEYPHNNARDQFSYIENGQGLYETHVTQSQQFQATQNSQFFLKSGNKYAQQQFQTNSMPVSSYQDSFFACNDENYIIQPIMPWQIEFKNLKLIKKRKRTEKTEKGQSRNSKRNRNQVPQSQISFVPQILDRKEVVAEKDIRKKFQNQKFSRSFKQKNLQKKQFDFVHSEYHLKYAGHSRNLLNKKISQREGDQVDQQLLGVSLNQTSFVFDIDQNINQQFVKYEEQKNQDEQTRFIDGENFQNDSNENRFSRQAANKVNKNSSFFGAQMGVNNIRQIKKLIVNQVNQKGKTSLDQMNKMLVNLSPQQMFTIFLHLTNQHQFDISNQGDDQSTIILSIPKKRQINQQTNSRQNIFQTNHTQIIEI